MDMILKKYSKILQDIKSNLFLLRQEHSHTKTHFKILDLWFVLILFVSCGALLFMVSEVSISYKEAYRILREESFLCDLIWLLFDVFGVSDYSLRGSFIAIHCCNMVLLYKIGKLYLRKASDSLFLVVIYALLPGINLGAILISKSGFIIFMLLLICYVNLRYKRIPYVLIFLSGFFDIAFSVVFIALGIYAATKRKTKTFIASIIGFGINMFLYSNAFRTGVPKSYFLDSLGMFAMLLSPFLFIYLVYALYAGIAKRKEQSLMLYIASSGIVFGLLLSMRQQIDMHSFAPLCVVGLPIMVYDFFSNMRLRLKIYRARFFNRMFIILGVAFLHTFFIFGNKLTYLVSPNLNFASNYYIAKDVAKILESKQITTLKVQDSNLALRLNFYGIKTNNVNKFDKNNADSEVDSDFGLDSGICLYNKSQKYENAESIKVRYMGRVIKEYALVRCE